MSEDMDAKDIAIRELMRQLAETEAERDEARHDYLHIKAAHDANVKVHGEAEAYYNKLIEAQAENTRLRQGLEEIAAGPYNGFEQCRAIARNTLSQAPENVEADYGLRGQEAQLYGQPATDSDYESPAPPPHTKEPG